MSCSGLVDRNPQHAERVLAEWTLAGALGDLVAPLLVAGAAGLRANDVALLAQVFTPLDLAIPVVLGFVADRYGLGAALLGLLVQPLGLLAALARSRRGPS